VGPLRPGYEIFDPRLLDVEKAILRAMRDGLPAEAERQLRIGESYMS
jgi:hypothetical protein